jgi:hypothetical protein
MSIDDLQSLKNRIEIKIKKLTAQIQAKKIEFTKNESDAARERYSLNVNRRILPFLAEMIKQRNMRERSLSDYFVDEAQIFLDKETYNAIMRNAMREKKLLSGK